MRKIPVIYLNHILECITRINEYTKGLDERKFLEKPIIQDAVIRNLEIIGEATRILILNLGLSTLKLSGRRLQA